MAPGAGVCGGRAAATTPQKVLLPPPRVPAVSVGRASGGLPRGAWHLQSVLSLPFQAQRPMTLNTITKLLMMSFKRQLAKCRQFFLSSPLVSGSHPASNYCEALHDFGYLQRLNTALGICRATSSCLDPAKRCPLSSKASRPYATWTAPGTE